MLTRVDPSEVLCPECRIQAAPESDRAGLGTLYTAHRLVRAGIHAPRSERCTSSTSSVISRCRGHRSSWSQLYALKVPEWNTGWPQPTLRFTPDDPSESPILFVSFAADVVHELVPRSWMAFRWSYANPDRRGHLELMGWDDPALADDDLALIAQGVRFFREFAAAAAGRPRGRFKRDHRWYLDEYRAFSRSLGRRPTQAAFCEHCGVDRTR